MGSFPFSLWRRVHGISLDSVRNFFFFNLQDIYLYLDSFSRFCNNFFYLYIYLSTSFCKGVSVWLMFLRSFDNGFASFLAFTNCCVKGNVYTWPFIRLFLLWQLSCNTPLSFLATALKVTEIIIKTSRIRVFSPSKSEIPAVSSGFYWPLPVFRMVYPISYPAITSWADLVFLCGCHIPLDWPTHPYSQLSLIFTGTDTLFSWPGVIFSGTRCTRPPFLSAINSGCCSGFSTRSDVCTTIRAEWLLEAVW